jgi:hypothetical protein
MKSKQFGSRLVGAGAKVEIDQSYVRVRGAIGFPKAEALISDIDEVAVRKGALIRIQLVGKGNVLGQAILGTIWTIGVISVAEQAAEWLRWELARRTT